jgi:hypothetical protein
MIGVDAPTKGQQWCMINALGYCNAPADNSKRCPHHPERDLFVTDRNAGFRIKSTTKSSNFDCETPRKSPKKVRDGLFMDTDPDRTSLRTSLRPDSITFSIIPDRVKH